MRKDLTNKKFGRLTAIRQAEDKYYGEYGFYNSRNQISEVTE